MYRGKYFLSIWHMNLMICAQSELIFASGTGIGYEKHTAFIRVLGLMPPAGRWAGTWRTDQERERDHEEFMSIFYRNITRDTASLTDVYEE